MIIHIEDLKFQTIIGILDFEREKEQNVIINATIAYDYIDEFINYADVVTFIKNEMFTHKFLLIEDALIHFKIHLKEKFPLINKAHLKITKPSILHDAQVSVSDTYLF
jgi:7,8-dihydroneopterin aldolase/epimerase/oxygenase